MGLPFKNKNDGFTAVVVMSVIVLIVILGAGLLQFSISSQIHSTRWSQEIAARCAADAGITKAIADLTNAHQQGTLDLGSFPLQSARSLDNCEADFEYTIYQNLGGDILIDCTGMSGSASKSVHCKVDVESKRFEHALFADIFKIKNNVYIDGYDSNMGSYDSADALVTSIATNSTKKYAVEFYNNITIVGDIVVGPGANLSKVIKKKNNARVTGKEYAAEKEKAVPAVSAPSGLPYKGLKPSGTLTESGIYDRIRTSNNEIIIIYGDITLYIKGKVELGSSSTIIITEGSSLRLYIEDDFKMGNNAEINNLAEKPINCMIYSTADKEVNFLFNNKGDFYGTLYAPNGKIEIRNNANIYGAIVAKKLKIDNNSKIHWDYALRKGSLDEPDARLVKGKWWE